MSGRCTRRLDLAALRLIADLSAVYNRRWSRMLSPADRPLRRTAMVLVVAAALLAGTPPLPDQGLLARQPLVVTMEWTAPARFRRRRHYRGYFW